MAAVAGDFNFRGDGDSDFALSASETCFRSEVAEEAGEHSRLARGILKLFTDARSGQPARWHAELRHELAAGGAINGAQYDPVSYLVVDLLQRFAQLMMKPDWSQWPDCVLAGDARDRMLQ